MGKRGPAIYIIEREAISHIDPRMDLGERVGVARERERGCVGEAKYHRDPHKTPQVLFTYWHSHATAQEKRKKKKGGEEREKQRIGLLKFASASTWRQRPLRFRHLSSACGRNLSREHLLHP